MLELTELNFQTGFPGLVELEVTMLRIEGQLVIECLPCAVRL
jgi:hypothetical protein